MNKLLSYAFNWCCANKLSINPYKFYCIIISPKSNAELIHMSLIMSDTTNNNVKYIGLLKEKQLNFLFHIKSIEQKKFQDKSELF